MVELTFNPQDVYWERRTGPQHLRSVSSNLQSSTNPHPLAKFQTAVLKSTEQRLGIFAKREKNSALFPKLPPTAPVRGAFRKHTHR